MITYSGRSINPLSKFNGTHDACPGLDDLVLGMGRQPRFVGQTRRCWTVLLHSLVCELIAKDLIEWTEAGTTHSTKQTRRSRWLCLMHDAHEGVTGDPPAFFKSDDMRVWQDEIDERLYNVFGVWPITAAEKEFVKFVDEKALRAEALVVGPPAIMQHLSDPEQRDVEIVNEIAAKYPSPLDTDGIDSRAAKDFLNIFAELFGSAVRNRTDDTPFTVALRSK